MRTIPRNFEFSKKYIQTFVAASYSSSHFFVCPDILYVLYLSLVYTQKIVNKQLAN